MFKNFGIAHKANKYFILNTIIINRLASKLYIDEAVRWEQRCESDQVPG